jgi:hypothetical protein
MIILNEINFKGLYIKCLIIHLKLQVIHLKLQVI